jgi:hypothetical protein
VGRLRPIQSRIIGLRVSSFDHIPFLTSNVQEIGTGLLSTASHSFAKGTHKYEETVSNLPTNDLQMFPACQGCNERFCPREEVGPVEKGPFENLFTMRLADATARCQDKDKTWLFVTVQRRRCEFCAILIEMAEPRDICKTLFGVEYRGKSDWNLLEWGEVYRDLENYVELKTGNYEGIKMILGSNVDKRIHGDKLDSVRLRIDGDPRMPVILIIENLDPSQFPLFSDELGFGDGQWEEEWLPSAHGQWD